MGIGARRKVVAMSVAGASLILAAVPALAQEAQYGGEEISATGPVSAADDPIEGRTYFLDDYTTAGSAYQLVGDADFEAYVGRQATAYGVPGESSISGLTPLYVSRIGPPENGGYTTEKVVADFELAVEGEPPADATFWGNWGPNYAFGSVRLADPDGDGVYTGRQPAHIPVDADGVVGINGPHPVWIEQRGPRGTSVLEDFGEVTLRAGDNDFPAGVTFDEGIASNVEDAPVGDAARVETGEGALPATGGAVFSSGFVGALLIVGGVLARYVLRPKT